jgi:hypothetical protein
VKRKVASKKTTKRKVVSKKTVKRKRHKIIKGMQELLHGLTTSSMPPTGWRVTEYPAAEWTAEEAAVFDSITPPDGFAYQWSPTESTFRMELKGWTRVPFSRHPALGKPLNFDGYIVYRGMSLFQISADLVQQELSMGRVAAINQTGEFGEAFDAIRSKEGRGFYIMSPSFVATESYETVASSAPALPLQLTITFMMPARWQDAASALKLSPAEYSRRRVAMEGLLMAPDESGAYAPFELTTRKVD